MRHFILTLFCFFTFICSLEAGYTIYNGKLMDSANVPEFSPDEHYERGVNAFNQGDYDEAVRHFNVISLNFPHSGCYSDSLYYLGISYYHLAEFDFSNEAFNNYIKCESSPRYFEEAITYKLDMANQFSNGAKRRPFKTKLMPKWAPAKALAIQIYNEVIAALPCHDLAAQAIWAKARVLWEDYEFKGSVEAFQQLIRRFPKHEYAPAAYLCINEVYYSQAQFEFHNPDLLALAQINVKRFQKDFPKDERVEEAKQYVQEIKELYAKGLFETGQFYERKSKPTASIIYYRSAIEQFPDTNYAKCCRRRLNLLTEGCLEGKPKTETVEEAALSS